MSSHTRHPKSAIKKTHASLCHSDNVLSTYRANVEMVENEVRVLSAGHARRMEKINDAATEKLSRFSLSRAEERLATLKRGLGEEERLNSSLRDELSRLQRRD